MQIAILLDLPMQDLPLLRQFGVAESQLASWSERRRNKPAMHELVALARPIANEDLHIEEHCAETTSKATSLDLYFGEVLESGLKLIKDSNQTTALLAINLMPYHLSLTLVDKIGNALINTVTQSVSAVPNLHVLFLVRNTDWFSKSVIFADAIRKVSQIQKHTIVDVRGYSVSFNQSGAKEEALIARELFQRILAFEGNAFYRALIYGTNSFLGHFQLNNSHVRTHYDLSQFIQRDDVQEHLASMFQHLATTYERIAIFGVGLEQNAIDRFGLFLRTRFEDRVRAFEYVFDPTKPVDHLACCDGCDCAVVLTDIVNTGRTLEPLVQHLKRRQGLTVKVFTIIRMENSPKAITDVEVIEAVWMRRKFYSNNPKECPLCQVHQPLRIVAKSDDFKHVAPEQPTPYDFWEIVSDSKALKENLADPQGRTLAYRVETAQIVKRYRYWIRNVIRTKYDATWPGNRPSALCTLDEAPGSAFAALVAESLDVRTIVRLSREDLRTATASGGPSTRRLDDVKTPILIVDDGINYGHTMESLINFCRFSKVTPIGALVFDSRLGQDEIRLLRSKMGGQPILALYTWPSPPIPAEPF